ncbi:hypothetical protein BANRA_00265 [Acinetobacter baumannii]|nr:hypothetical protein BANRA_00265 [Acinetobacter baumannii]
MSKRKIEVYTQALSQLLLKSKQDFPDFRSFNHYKTTNTECQKSTDCRETTIQFNGIGVCQA